MATHTRYAEIKEWAQATGRRSIQLWMPTDAIRLLDQLCGERKVGRAERLSSLISAATCEYRADREAEKAQRPQS